MSDAGAFLDAIFAQPDDDTPRLVYADWLEEHGQASYARFIRLQCEAARCPLWGAEANRLWEEIGRVWPEVQQAFSLGSAGEWVLSDRYDTGNLDAIHFRRGLPLPGVCVRFEQLIQNWSLWWPWFPAPDCTLVCESGWETRAAECPTLSRIRRLRLLDWAHDGIREMNVWPFLASPHLSHLESLDLSDDTLDVVAGWGIDRLTHPEMLPRVSELRVRIADVARFSGLGSDPVPCTTVTPGSPHAQLEAKFGGVEAVPAGDW